MVYWQRFCFPLPAFMAAAFLSACGGSGSSKPAAGNGPLFSDTTQQDAPATTDDMATDALNWFNFQRQEMGLDPLTRNASLDAAASRHSLYQSINDVISHEQVKGKRGFTGQVLSDRLQQAGYRFNRGSYSYGEVITATGNRSGIQAAEDLITAIYHRFVVFEPRFTEAGAGFASRPEEYIYFTTNFAANGLGPGLGKSALAVYPISNQGGVTRNFYSDREIPDPVPEKNEVGYPISVHADITSEVNVRSFTLRPRGKGAVSAKLLSHANDSKTPASAAALVPLEVLAAKTIYDVRFVGTVDDNLVERNWSFSTQ